MELLPVVVSTNRGFPTFIAMKHLVFLCFIFLALSCNDGDLQIAPVDFDASPLQTCDAPVTVGTGLFFKLNGENALIVELPDGVLLNEVSTDSIVSSIPSQTAVTYRIFDASVTSAYFCDAVPPASPVIVEDVAAEAGELVVNTVQNPTDTTAYDHTLSLRDLTLVNQQGQRLTNLNEIVLGTVTTTQ